MRGRAVAWLLVLAGTVAGPDPAHANLVIEQSVNSEVLIAGAVVEFVVTVRNTGAEAVASGEVGMSFSAGLGEPPGTAPFFSQGNFDPAEGRWVLGELLPGASAVLSMPAQVSPDPLPPCVYSRAQLDASEGEPAWVGEVAFAPLRRAGVEHCVDLVVELASPFTICAGPVRVPVSVWNLGPDAAHEVHVSVSQQPVLPSLRFELPCDGGLECTLEFLGAEDTAVLTLRSDFSGTQAIEVTVEAVVSSSGADLRPGQEAISRTFTFSPSPPCDFGPVEVEFDKSGGSCFIATAAYGSALHPRVVSLRRFRDRFLITNAPGRALVAAYYRASPPMASFIAERPAARALTRALLWPLVLAVEHSMRSLGTILAGLLLWRYRRRVRRISLPG